MSDITMVMEYRHPVSRVWQALTDARAMSEWLMPNDFEPRVGHQFRFRTEPAPGFDGIVHCEVLELVEPRRLSFSWKGGPIDTVVTFELDPTASGTRLRFTQRGFAGFKAGLVRLILKSGSRSIYRKRLPAVLDRLAGVVPPSVPEEGCARRGLWRVLASVFAPILRRKG